MLGEGGTPLDKVLAAIREYQARDLDPENDDLAGLRAGMDGMESEFSAMARRAKQRGGPLPKRDGDRSNMDQPDMQHVGHCCG